MKWNNTDFITFNITIGDIYIRVTAPAFELID